MKTKWRMSASDCAFNQAIKYDGEYVGVLVQEQFSGAEFVPPERTEVRLAVRVQRNR